MGDPSYLSIKSLDSCGWRDFKKDLRFKNKDLSKILEVQPLGFFVVCHPEFSSGSSRNSKILKQVQHDTFAGKRSFLAK